MNAPRTIHVRITADTREFRRQIIRAQLLFTRPWWKRLSLRLALWRIDRERPPA